MSLFLVFLVYICTVTEIRGSVNDPTLIGIVEVQNTDKLFTGMAYQIQDPLNSDCNLAWNESSRMFMMRHAISPVVTSAIFYLVHVSKGYYYVKNAALNGAENLVTKCTTMEDGTRTCYLTIERMNPSDQILYASYLFSPQYAEVGEPEQRTIPLNTYILDQSTGDLKFAYGSSNELEDHIKLRFVPQVKLDSELIGMSITSPPMNTPDSYISQNKRQLWRETIINPTALTREKTFKQKSVGVPDTETITTTTQVPESISNRLKRTIRSGNDENSKPKEVTETVELEETITIPPYTCMEVYLMTEPETSIQQNIAARIKVSGKVTRFSYGSSVMRKSKLVPGMVVEQVLKEENFRGKYVETRETDAIYEILGKLTSERGIHSSVISQEIDCPNSNKKVPAVR